MDGISEFVIPVHKGQEIRHERNHITNLYGVHIEFTTSHLSTAQRIGNEWIKLIGSKQARQNAEVYIKGIANPEITRIFTIPEDLVASVVWLQNIIFFVQKECLAVVRLLNQTQLLLQGNQLAVAKAVSVFEDCITRARQSLTQNAAMGYAPHNQMYHGQQSLQYYHQYQRTGMHFESPDRCSSYRNQDKTESLPRGQMQNLGHLEQVIAKGMILPGHQEKQPDSPAQNHQRIQKLNEHLRDFAQKLGYTDEEINTAISRFDAAMPSQALDENSLLQYLTQLYPRKQPLLRNNVESKIVKDSSSTSATAQVQGNVKDVNTEEKDQAANDVPHNQELRHIVVDGSNVAMSHGNRDVFSCKGIKICVDYFKQRGHDEITVFVPQWRKEASKPDRQIEDQQILFDLENEQTLSFTPSRRVNGQRVVCYDDRYIVKLAAENDGIIVSNDNFRDLVKENPEWKKVIEERLLMYTFVKDVFMPPDDPLGRRGPKLDTFLRKGTQANPRLCPYMKKCTYGSKCKFYHPERVSQQNQPGPSTISKATTSDPVGIDIQKTQAPSNAQIQKENHQGSSVTNAPTKDATNIKPVSDTTQETPQETPQSDASDLQAKLEHILPNMKERIKEIIESNPLEKSLDTLVNMVLS